MRAKLRKLDFKSLKFKMWVYFGVFAVSLMVVLWFLQIFFLENYYEDMKTRQVVRAANEINMSCRDLDLREVNNFLAYQRGETFIVSYDEDNEEKIISFLNIIQEYPIRDDLYIHIESSQGLILATSADSFQRPSLLGTQQDIAEARQKLNQSNSGTISYIKPSRSGDIKNLVYARAMSTQTNGQTYLFIIAPLSPVESTVDILTQQLIIVTILSLLLAFCLSFFLSRRLSRPLIQITRSASKLAKGEYGITFEGGHYTEIIELADTLTYTSKELARTDELKKDLLANVSHDLRTPLTMVKSYAEMIRDLSGDNPAKRNAHLKVIIDEADRLNLLVNDLLALSKMQSGVTSLTWDTFDLSEAVQNILNSYTIMIEQDGYHLDFICEGNTRVKGDEQRIKQVISNLLNNALRYSGESKNVSILAKELPEGILFQVTDFGVGIPKEELDQIWDRYYRASNHGQRTASGGSGLGLAIVKEILDLHGAKFGVKSQVGVGSTFWFMLKK